MKVSKIRGGICGRVVKGVCFRRCIPASVFLLLLHCLAIYCTSAELKQKTVEAFDRYIRVTDARMDAELRPGGPILAWNRCPMVMGSRESIVPKRSVNGSLYVIDYRDRLRVCFGDAKPHGFVTLGWSRNGTGLFAHLHPPRHRPLDGMR